MHGTYHKCTNSINWQSTLSYLEQENGFLDLAMHEEQVKYSILELLKLQYREAELFDTTEFMNMLPPQEAHTPFCLPNPRNLT